MTQPLSYSINGQVVQPQAFYAVACHPLRHVVVEACAGAGKTWMLVARIVRALLLGTAPQNILAITFTNKAAAEMRGRVDELMAAWAHMSDAALTDELLARGLPLDDITPDVLVRARGMHASVLAGRGVGIRTFHGWFASLLRMAPLSLMHSLSLPSPYELLQDDSEAVALVWPHFYKAVYNDEQLRSDFNQALAANGRSNLHEALSFALGKRVELGLASERTLLEGVRSVADTVPAFANCTDLDQALEQMPGLAAALREAAVSMGSSGNTAAMKTAVALGEALDRRNVKAACAQLLTATGTPKKTGVKATQPELVEAAQAWALDWRKAKHQAQCIAHQQRMSRLSLCLIECFTQLKRQRGWVDMNDIELAATQLLADSELSAWVQQRLDASVSQLLIDEFQDTNPMQWRALLSWLEGYVGAGGGNVPHVFIVGDPKQSIYRFRRAEPKVFQAATAFVQDALGGDVLACDHTRRNAQSVVAALNAVMTEPSSVQATAAQAPTFRPHSTAQADLGQVLALPLVEPASGANDAQDSADAASDWRDSLLTPKLVLEDKRAALETRQAAQWVARQIERGVSAKDIMVIARTNARLGLMQASLATLGIPCAQPEKTTLIDSPAVADVVALLDALISPANNLALATALRSPLFGATDAQLLNIASHVVESAFNGARSDGQTKETHTAGHSSRAVDATHASDVVDTGLTKPRARNWREALQHLAEQDSSEPAYARWAASLTLMTQWLQQQPLVQLITRIYDHCNVYQAYAGAMPAAMVGAAHAQLTALLDESLALNQGRFVTPYQFVRAVKSAHHKRAWPTPADAVRLLTVHGAKGLEAHHVLLLDTHAPAQKAQSMSMLVDWPSEAPAPKRVVFVAKETSPPVCAQALLASDQAARRVEENNALYVAMTRAVQQLVVSAHTRSGNKDESWWSRLQRCAQPRVLSIDALGAPAQVASPPVAEVHIKRLPRWTAQRVFAATSTAASVGVGTSAVADPHAAQASDLAARLGQAMHQLLEWLPATVQMGSDLWTPEQLKQVASNWQLNAEQSQTAHRWALAVTQGEGAWAWDEQCVGFAGNEVEMTVAGALMRLDRLVFRRDTQQWWVLDFKSSQSPQHDAALLEQLNTYRNAVALMYPTHTVRAAFLTSVGALIEPHSADAAPS